MLFSNVIASSRSLRAKAVRNDLARRLT